MSIHPGQPPRFRVGVVGAGRVGVALGAALARAGHHVVAASGISEASRARATAMLPGVPLRQPDEVAQAADLVLLTVPDDALADLVAGLAARGVWRAGHVVVHTCGAHGMAPLEPATEAGAIGAAVHPVLTFTGSEIDLARLQDACCGVTTDERWRPVAEALVIEMGADPVWVAEDDRVRYHAALAHGANHGATLVAQCLAVLGEAGIDEPARLAGPLLRAALENALAAGDQALTGPVARGDAGTVRAHVRELHQSTPDVLLAYRAVAHATVVRGVTSGRVAPSVAAQVLDALGVTEENPE